MNGEITSWVCHDSPFCGSKLSQKEMPASTKAVWKVFLWLFLAALVKEFKITSLIGRTTLKWLEYWRLSKIVIPKKYNQLGLGLDAIQRFVCIIDYDILRRGDFYENFFVLRLLYIPLQDQKISCLRTNEELLEHRALVLSTHGNVLIMNIYTYFYQQHSCVVWSCRRERVLSFSLKADCLRQLPADS